MNEKIDKLLDMLTREKYFRLRLLIEGIIVGIGTGIAVGVFRFLLAETEVWRPWVYQQVGIAYQAGDWLWPAAYGLAFVVIAFLVHRIVQNEPMCTGSGIPQIKGILLGKMYMRWHTVVLSKIIGGVLAIGAGLSLGREGPSVQIGAAVGQGISRNAKRTRFEERILLTAGAGAGLAAAFNAPLAGVVFGLEELQKSFSPVLLLASITAAVTATTVAGVIFGFSPIFTVGQLEPLPLAVYGCLIVLGIFVGSLGRLFNPSLMLSMNCFARLNRCGFGKLLLPLMMAAVLGFILPEILGGGSHLVDALMQGSYPLGFLCLLLCGKFIFTMLSFGTGVPGGIFMPMLVIGAAAGAVCGQSLISLGLMEQQYLVNLTAFGMAAYFAAVVKSPVTGSILIMEMTGSFQHMLALIIVSLAAYIVSDMTGGKPVYEELLDRSLRQRNHQGKLQLAITGQRVAVELVIHPGSMAAGRLISSIAWPGKTVLVDLRRGMYRLVPEGDVTLQPGDYLYVLTEDTEVSELKHLVE